MRRPSPLVLSATAALLAASIVLSVLVSNEANWDLRVGAMLLAFAVASDQMALQVRAARVKVSGSFLAIVVATALLGAPPAVVIALIATGAGTLRERDPLHYLLPNLAIYATFPVVSWVLFDAARDSWHLAPGDTGYAVAVYALFVTALVLNFLMVAAYRKHLEGQSIKTTVVRILAPLATWELVAGFLAVGIVEVEVNYGVGALLVFGALLLGFQQLLGELLKSEERAEDLGRRTEQLASLQVGLLSAMLRTLDLRDRMTARHSAAVARYAREIAKAAGLSEAEQELSHTAGLLHDIGKFVFPDSILKGDTRLTDEEYEIVKMHPFHGAQVLGQIEGYGPVANIVLAHHERIDGTGYPNGIPGDEIPIIARIISVADTYDVMTSRDSYRNPVTSQTAIAELRRVSGTQLDGTLVEIFIAILETKDLRYRHGEDADFETELHLERRVTEYASSTSLPIINAP